MKTPLTLSSEILVRLAMDEAEGRVAGVPELAAVWELKVENVVAIMDGRPVEMLDIDITWWVVVIWGLWGLQGLGVMLRCSGVMLRCSRGCLGV